MTPPAGTYTQHGKQWIRSANLVVLKGGQGPVGSPTTYTGPTVPLIGLDLSQLHFHFSIHGADLESPNTMVVRIYNLAESTANALINEYDHITLQAGYVGAAVGVVFCGTIKQFKKGKESNTDTYLEISAGDNDLGYNFGFVNLVLATNSTPGDILTAAAVAMGVTVDPAATDFLNTTGIVYPRGQVVWNLSRVVLRGLAETHSARWFVTTTAPGKSVLHFVPNTSYLPGEAIVIGSDTGLISTPESTANGITFRCELNPLLKIGSAVYIDSGYITGKKIIQQGYPTRTNVTEFTAIIDTQKLYRVLSLDMEGDNRGQDWYSDVVCLAISASNPTNPVIANP